MGDSIVGEAAFLSGQEIVNNERVLAYLAAGYGPPSLQVSGGCGCPRIKELIACGSEDPYLSPKDDPAPWYDASVPESADFAGFLSVSCQGLGSTYSRSPIDKVTGGAVLGRLRPKARPLIWRGFLFGRSDCAVRYGLSWLAANLKGPECFCGGEDLDLLVCCPELTENPPETGCMSLPAIARPLNCPPYAQPDAFRTLKNVGLLEGPTIISERRTGCTSSCGSKSCSGEGSLIIEVEFTLLAGNPYLYSCPVCLCSEQGFPEVGDCSINPLWVKVDADFVTTLRPNGVVNTSGITNTGAASSEAAVANPDSDASYITISHGFIRFDFTTFALPTGATIQSVTPRLRYDGASLYMQLQSPGATDPTLPAPGTAKTNNFGTNGGPYDYVGAVETTNFAGAAWTQADIDSIRLFINDYNFNSRIYEAYIDVTYRLGTDLSSVCTDDCPEPYDCTKDEAGCPKVVLPTIPDYVDGCFCPALAPVRTCCEIPSDSFGKFFEGAPIIEIYSGSSIMRSTTVRFYDNPQGLPCCDIAEDPCRNCDSVQIRYIPADSTLTIDGTTRTVSLKCPGMGAPILADHLTVTPFAWPILSCTNFCICTETEGATVADDASVSILIVPREI